MFILGVPQKVIEKKPVRNNNVAFQSGADREELCVCGSCLDHAPLGALELLLQVDNGSRRPPYVLFISEYT